MPQCSQSHHPCCPSSTQGWLSWTCGNTHGTPSRLSGTRPLCSPRTCNGRGLRQEASPHPAFWRPVAKRHVPEKCSAHRNGDREPCWTSRRYARFSVLVLVSRTPDFEGQVGPLKRWQNQHSGFTHSHVCTTTRKQGDTSCCFY
jgi:hypothetical protein